MVYEVENCDNLACTVEEFRTLNRGTPGSNPPRCYFEAPGIVFPPRCLNSLSSLNEYVAIKSGGNM